MDEIARRWRELFLETVEPYRDEPLLLSGGVDSATIVAAQIELGSRPDCFAFRLGGNDSTDVAVARKIARDFALPLRVVEIPTDLESVERDVRTLLRFLGDARKTLIQCSHPFLYLASSIAHYCDVDRALVGTGAVVLDDRRVATLAHYDGEEAARAYRRSKMSDRYENTGTGAMHRTSAAWGVTLDEPYSENPIRDYGLSLDYAELNRPRQKGIALRAFPDFWKRGYWRRNSPLQVNSGLRELHAQLLDTPLNRRGSKDVRAIYNDLLREETHAVVR